MRLRMLLAATILSISFFQPEFLRAQSDDGDNGSGFEAHVDSIVNNIFQKFDREVGTYIFLEEPDDLHPEEDGEGLSSTQEGDDVDAPRSYRRSERRGKQWQVHVSTSAARSLLHRNSPLFYPWEEISDDFLLKYNRVQGLFIGLSHPKTYTWSERDISLFGSLGYGFANHRWNYGIGMAQQFVIDKHHLVEFGVEGHGRTDTQDQWIIDDGENTFTSFVARDDYRDYFHREGLSFWTGYYYKSGPGELHLQAAFLNDRHESLDRMTNWSLFGGSGKIFRDNPMIDDGRIKSLALMLEAGSTSATKYFVTGWSVAVSGELAPERFRNDFVFNRYLFDVRRYQPLGRYENLNLRLRLGSGTGNVPAQYAFGLGGLGTLPAFSFKEFSGNRLFLANIEYLLNGRLFDDVDLFPSWMLRNVNIIVFADAGYAGAASPDDAATAGFKEMTFQNLKSDWGVGMGSRDGKMRLGFAWRTDISAPVHVFLRLERPF